MPEDSEILFEHVSDDQGHAYSIPYLVYANAVLTGDVLQDARVSIGDFNEPYVSVTFDSKGAQEFDRITQANVGETHGHCS